MTDKLNVAKFEITEDTKQCCNPFPCPYIGKDKTCEECNCYREDFWNEDDITEEADND